MQHNDHSKKITMYPELMTKENTLSIKILMTAKNQKRLFFTASFDFFSRNLLITSQRLNAVYRSFCFLRS